MADDLYSLLGVPKGSEADVIKKAYRKLAKDLHPDKNPGNKPLEARFKKVNHAYEVLGDPKKRKLYDEFGEEGLRDGFDPDRVRQYRQWSSRQGQGGVAGRGGSYGGMPGETVNLEDLFGGGGVGGGAGNAGNPGFQDMFGDLFGRSRRGRGPMKGPDLESSITIDFVSAVRGATLELRPQGAGGSPVTVRVPPGAAEGSRVRIAGHGAPSTSGGPPGDLILEIHVSPHTHFRREGDDLHLDLPITIAEAYRGAKVKVPTTDGAVTLKVPPHAQSGTQLRLRGKGVARKGKEAGDLYVHFMVRVPASDAAHADEVGKLVDQLAAYDVEDPRQDIKF
jgi:curved DNA-binding protein